ncbi:MAG: TonB family protein [Ignavibacteriaceae bacterium]|nr:TonB family protein [Ignavibacteriaceae bacterium]
MLKNIFLIIFIFAFTISAQNGLVKAYFPSGKIESEINYVNKIREGTVKFYFENGNIRQEFSYINGKVEGLVKEYYETGKLKLSYIIADGKKEGQESLFKEDGTYLNDITYERGKRVMDNNPLIADADTTSKNSGISSERSGEYVPPVIAEDTISADSVYTIAEVMPDPVGGMNGIYKRLVYPASAKENKIEGVVKIEMLIDKAGDVTESKILNDIGFGCGESAKITIFYTRFKPGLQRGKPVKVRMIIPVIFKLPALSK